MFGFEVDVDTFVPGMASVLEPLDIPRIRISGLKENTNKEMLAMYFELEYGNGEGKVKNIDIDKKRKFAIIEFEEKAGAEAFLLRNPKSILGMDVTVEVIETASDKSRTKSTRIKITGLAENHNKEMLEMFFKTEERKGGGKVNNIFIDGKNRCALIEFEDETGVEWIMNKAPISIFGVEVGIETLDDLDEPKKIQITNLPVSINKEMLKMFFDSKTEFGGKIIDISIKSEENIVIVEFGDSTAVYRIMEERPLTILGFNVDVDVFAVHRVLDQKPLTIFGLEVDVDTFVPGMASVLEPLDIPRIRISGLKENTNKEMLAMYFELEYGNGEGKVKNIDIDKKRKFAIIEFEEKAGAEAFLLRNPKSILGMDVTVEVIETTSDKSRTKSTRIKITGLAENHNKEMLEMFFKTKERKGGGKVNNIFIDGKNRCALIEFEDETGVEWIMNKAPISIFGVEVGIETLDDLDEPKKIQITNLPVSINKEMLKMFFDNKTEFGGKIIDISIKSEENIVIVEFGDSTAVYRIMEERPLTILGFNVDIDVFDASHVVESQDIPRIGILGLQENTNNEMLAMYFQQEERKGGGKVKNIEINHKGKFVTIDFEEKAGADAFLLRNPKSILGMDVTVKVIETTSDRSRTKSTRIKVSGLEENTNKEMLEMFFKTEERKGGGKVNNIFIDGKNRCAIIEFEDETGADRILNKTPTLILGKEVETERIDDIDQPKKIQFTKLPVCMTEGMLKKFFEDKTDFGGNVIDISITSKEKKAIVEFDNSTAVYRIMDVQPLTILGCKVDVDIFVSDTSTVVKPRNIQRIKISGQMENTNKEMATMYYEHAERNCGRMTKHNEMDQIFPMIDFEEEAGDKVTSQTEHAESGIQRAASFQTTETGRTRFGEKEHDSPQEYGDKVTSQTEHAESGIQAAASLQTTETGRTRFGEKVQDSPQEYGIFKQLKKHIQDNFLSFTGSKINSERAGRGIHEAESLQRTGEKINSEHAGRGIQKAESSQTTESVVANNAESNPFESDLKRPDSSKPRGNNNKLVL
ncbi:uncharacterized protein LOC132718958 [Ruditapes philippinarum]|uniref:uncharacterized protein LOC132718958 n=1 Tax=Ruditapes philippinarum TaxID=129788 RepID=UPI00295B6C51|nr:uncharacterized protein LOC132718958 [Ruditapes philippinarum]